MSQVCQICGRGTQTSNNVSHSKRRTKRTQKINLQSKKVDNKKMRICTGCIKNQVKSANSK